MESSNFDTVPVDVLFSQIQDKHTDSLRCSEHSEQIGEICIASEKPENVFKLCCRECAQSCEKTIYYPKKFLEEIRQYLSPEYPSQYSQLVDKIPAENLTRKGILEFLDQYEHYLDQIEESTKLQRALIKQKILTIQEIDDLPEISIHNFVQQMLNQLSESVNFEEIQKTINELKVLQANQNKAFSFEEDKVPRVKDPLYSDVKNDDLLKESSQLLELISKMQKQVELSLIRDNNQEFCILQTQIKPGKFQIDFVVDQFEEFQNIYSFFSLGESTVATIGSKKSQYYLLILDCSQEVRLSATFPIGQYLNGFGRNIAQMNGQLVACGLYQQIIIVNYQTLKIQRELDLDKQGTYLNCLIYDQNKKFWISLSGAECNFDIILVNQDQFKIPYLVLQGHQSNIHELQLIHNSHIASASADQTIRIWNQTTGVCLQLLTLDYPVHSICFDFTKNLLFSVGNTQQVTKHIFSLKDQAKIEQQEYLLEKSGYLSNVQVVDGGLILSTSGQGLKFFDFSTKSLSEMCNDFPSVGRMDKPCLYSANGRIFIVFTDQFSKRMVKLFYSE